MKGFVEDIEHKTEENSDFRHVLYTGKNMQLVLMSLKAGEEIGEEVHPDRDQFFRVETGEGEVWIDGTKKKIKSDTGIVVPAGARHNVKNTGHEPLKLYTISTLLQSMPTKRCRKRKLKPRLRTNTLTARRRNSGGSKSCTIRSVGPDRSP